MQNNNQNINNRLIGYQERKKFISKAIYIKDFDGEYIEDEDSQENPQENPEQ